MRAVDYLCFGEVEVGNAVRTLNYIRNGLIPDCSLFVGDAGYDDWYCSAIDDGPYVDPATDLAPWYVSAYPESEDFLGLLPIYVDLGTGLTTSTATPRNGNGAVITGKRRAHRIVTVKGWLIASSSEGMAWGERWLQEVLEGTSPCAGCASDQLVVLPACPTAVDPDPYFRYLHNVAVVSGPDLKEQDNPPDYEMQLVQFQLAAGVPELIAPGEVEINALTLSGQNRCATITTEAFGGDKALVIEVAAKSVNAISGVQVTMTPDGNSNPCLDFAITLLPPSHTLVVDAVKRTVQVIRDATGEVVGGMSALSWDGTWQWPIVPPCSEVEVCVNGVGATVNATTVTTVTSYRREL